MSEEKQNKAAGEESENDVASADLAPVNNIPAYLDVIINKSANEIGFKDPTTGQVIKINARITDINEDEDEEDIEPLTPEAFRTALQRIDDLGLTWTADRLPALRPKEGTPDEIFFSEELDEIQNEYPRLPREIASILFYIFTGNEIPEDIVGGKEDIEKKEQIIREFILSNNYKSEFFFKHAIKVPYLTGIDWEVVFKLREKSVKVIPGVCYALLSLEFHNPNVDVKSTNRNENFTVAVNERLVDNLIATLTELKTQLEAAQKTAKLFADQSIPKDDTHANGTFKQLGQQEQPES